MKLYEFVLHYFLQEESASNSVGPLENNSVRVFE